MTTVAEVGAAMQSVLTAGADAAAEASGFVRRRSKLTGAKWARALVFGWMARPDAALPDLCHAAAAVGVEITPQGLDARFGERSAECMRLVLGEATGRLVAAADPAAASLLGRFAGGVRVRDATAISLPDGLAGVWPGCGGNQAHTASALKAVVELDLSGGRLAGPHLCPGKQQERRAPLGVAPADALELADLGFWDVGRMAEAGARGSYALSRLKANAAVYDAETGERLDVGAWLGRELRRGGRVDRWVLVGGERRLRMRLLALRVEKGAAERRRRRAKREGQKKGRAPSKARLALCGYDVYATNAPEEKLSAEEALVLARARWRIEMLFKLWKSHGRIDEWRTSDPWRILTELYAKLTAMLVQHWLFLVGCWGAANRSLAKAARVVSKLALSLASSLGSAKRLREAIRLAASAMGSGCRMGSRRKTPYTHQLLADPSLLGGLA